MGLELHSNRRMWSKFSFGVRRGFFESFTLSNFVARFDLKDIGTGPHTVRVRMEALSVPLGIKVERALPDALANRAGAKVKTGRAHATIAIFVPLSAIYQYVTRCGRGTICS